MNILKKLILLPLRLLSSEVAEHFEHMLHETYVALIHKIGEFKCSRYSGQKGLKVNFGCGANLKRNFLNIDFSPMADLRLDLRRLIPLSDESCSFIFSEHFVEHLTYPEGVERFFSECLRILEPGGAISISVPDTEWPIMEYAQNKKDYLEACKTNSWHPDQCTTFMEHINYHFRQRWSSRSYSDFENHRFAYDFETMSKKLSEQGFTNIQKREYDEHIDSPHRKVGSLFIKANKPKK